MRLLVVSDIHGHIQEVHRLVSSIGDIDLAVIAGDITNFGGYDAAAAVIEPILERKIPVLAVAGNCDTDGVVRYLHQNNIAIDGNPSRFKDLTFIGVNGSLPCPGITPNVNDEAFFESELNKALQQICVDAKSEKMKNLIVVTHQPAFGTQLDLAGNLHRGSQSIRKFITKHQPLLAVSGHIHEAFGIDHLGTTSLVNAGAFKQGCYAIVEIVNTQVAINLHCLE